MQLLKVATLHSFTFYLRNPVLHRMLDPFAPILFSKDVICNRSSPSRCLSSLANQISLCTLPCSHIPNSQQRLDDRLKSDLTTVPETYKAFPCNEHHSTRWPSCTHNVLNQRVHISHTLIHVLNSMCDSCCCTLDENCRYVCICSVPYCMMSDLSPAVHGSILLHVFPQSCTLPVMNSIILASCVSEINTKGHHILQSRCMNYMCRIPCTFSAAATLSKARPAHGHSQLWLSST
jgi:hypothetical protein